jgi:hypothetical protein
MMSIPDKILYIISLDHLEAQVQYAKVKGF